MSTILTMKELIDQLPEDVRGFKYFIAFVEEVGGDVIIHHLIGTHNYPTNYIIDSVLSQVKDNPKFNINKEFTDLDTVVYTREGLIVN